MISPARLRTAPPGSARRARITWTVRSAAGSVWWLVGVAAAFSCAQLVFVAPHLGLSWDEVVYVSQLSSHAPAANLDPARARGVSLLAAPVTMLTFSTLALRIYLSLLSGAGLLLALLAWWRLRPAWMLALAGICYASLWTAQYYGPQAMPDEWVAFSVLAAVGLFVRAGGTDRQPAGHARGHRWTLAGLAACVAIAALVRPGDALYVTAALVVAVATVRAWRRLSTLVAVVFGFVAGAAEWVIEAYVRYGGPFVRLHAAAAEQAGFGLHAGWWAELRALNGPTLCRPCTIGLRYPPITLWWLALPVIVALGVLAARMAGRLASSLLAAGCGLAVAFQYLFLISYAAPRFLLPAYAVLSIPVADALGFLIAGAGPVASGQAVPVRRHPGGPAGVRPPAVALISAALIAQLLIQHVVLTHQVREKQGYFTDFAKIAAALHRLGVRPPCLVKGRQDIPIAFYAGCASAPSVAAARRLHPNLPVAVLVHAGAAAPAYVHGWARHDLPGMRSRLLRVTAYVAPGHVSAPDRDRAGDHVR